jgi:hypothetical protein
MIPTAMSTTFPFIAKALNSSTSFIIGNLFTGY